MVDLESDAETGEAADSDNGVHYDGDAMPQELSDRSEIVLQHQDRPQLSQQLPPIESVDRPRG
jgi:hypothetical protein